MLILSRVSIGLKSNIKPISIYQGRIYVEAEQAVASPIVSLASLIKADRTSPNTHSQSV